MNTTTKLFVFLFSCITAVTACNSTADQTGRDYQSAADSTGQPSGSYTSARDTVDKALHSSAAVADNRDSIHQFIRTADLKFKVTNVARATYAIEDIVRQFNGFVTYTNLTSTVDDKSTVAVSADSSLQTTYFTVVNELKLRVPNTQLDTVLKSIASLVDYLDYRIIQADDVALQLLSNTLTQQRLTRNKQRLTSAIDSRGRKLTETTDAEEALLNKEEQRDEAAIANLALKDKIAYSTISIAVYQQQGTSTAMMANAAPVVAYRPGLGSRLHAAFESGWQAVENLLVVIVHLWSLLLAVFIGGVVYKNWGGRLKRRGQA